jgi:methylated-DNA-[protein]-cysteine S-methyltransferase
MNNDSCFTTCSSPVGPLLLTSNGRALTSLFLPGFDLPEAAEDREDQVLRDAREQLDDYFAGKLRSFDLKLAPHGTEFQSSVWRELSRIPFGVTISYADLAQRIGQPKACRAVGAANGRNPIAIIVPCHRVIGADGTLTGYGGGLECKRWLLEHEQEVLKNASGRIAAASV